ncbi:cyd operon YbgE family protein [Pantoea sp. MQR6]
MRHVFLMIWAVCTVVNHGIDFRPSQTRWQALFSPLAAWVISFLSF